MPTNNAIHKIAAPKPDHMHGDLFKLQIAVDRLVLRCDALERELQTVKDQLAILKRRA